MINRFTKPKSFPFPVYKDLELSALRDDRWAPQLIFSAQITPLYRQEPLKMLDGPIEPISFPVTRLFKKLVEAYRAFKYLNRQALWNSTHVFTISSRQR